MAKKHQPGCNEAGCCKGGGGGGACEGLCGSLVLDLSGLYTADAENPDVDCVLLEGLLNGTIDLALITNELDPDYCSYRYCKEDVSDIEVLCGEEEPGSGTTYSANFVVTAYVSQDPPKTTVTFGYYTKIVSGEGEEQVCRAYRSTAFTLYGDFNACEEEGEITSGGLPFGTFCLVAEAGDDPSEDSSGECICSSSSTKKSSEEKSGTDTTSKSGEDLFCVDASDGASGTIGPGGGEIPPDNEASDCDFAACPPKTDLFWIFAQCCSGLVSDPVSGQSFPEYAYVVQSDVAYDTDKVYELEVDDSSVAGRYRVCASPYVRSDVYWGPEAHVIDGPLDDCDECLDDCDGCCDQYLSDITFTAPAMPSPYPPGVCDAIFAAYSAQVAGQLLRISAKTGGCAAQTYTVAKWTYDNSDGSCDQDGDYAWLEATFQITDEGGGNYKITIGFRMLSPGGVWATHTYTYTKDSCFNCLTGVETLSGTDDLISGGPLPVADLVVTFVGTVCSEVKGMRVRHHAKLARDHVIPTTVRTAKLKSPCSEKTWKRREGPKMWMAIHQFAWGLDHSLDEWVRVTARLELHTYMMAQIEEIKCAACKEDTLAYVVEHLTDENLKDGCFAWTVALHNHVNIKTGKPAVPLAAAVFMQRSVLLPIITPTPKRPCDGCTLCCTLKGVTELKKPAWVACEHECAGACAIYALKPKTCTAYGCSWQLGDLPETMKPTECGFMLDCLDGTMNVIEVVPGTLMVVAGGVATLTPAAAAAMAAVNAHKHPQRVLIYIPSSHYASGLKYYPTLAGPRKWKVTLYDIAPAAESGTADVGSPRATPPPAI